MKAFGFDFGTTNSVMSFVSDERCIPILDDRYPHPSVVCYQGDQVISGRKAKEKLSNANSGVIGNIVKSPKTMLGEGRVEVDGHTYSPKEVVRDIILHVREDAKRQYPDTEFDRAVVTIPIDMNGLRRRELREACRMAGLSVVQFVHEPLAALYGHLRSKPDFESEMRRLNRELALVFDWGGGTLDLTLCRMVDGMLIQLMNDGCSDVGGDIIDDILVNDIEQRVLDERGIQTSVGRQVGALPRLRNSAESAKVQLSSKDVHTIVVPDYFASEAGDPDIAIRYRREQLEACVRDKVGQGIQRVERLLEKARVNPASIQLCLATGGMVNMPLIQMRLREIFGAQRVHISDRGNTVISEGAAWIAHDKARLSLAKNIEVLVARQGYFPLVKAGTLMPREGEIQRQPLTMYCSDPTDGVAKFQVMSPKRTGRSVQITDERDLLGSMSIGVDRASKPLMERLELEIIVDDDLILNCRAHSSLHGDVDNLEIHTLEFGLAVHKGDEDASRLESIESAEAATKDHGDTTLRVNVTPRDDDLSVVPGEVMYKNDRRYFDRETNRYLPEIQDLEKLNYQPCAYCQMAPCVCQKLRGLGWVHK